MKSMTPGRPLILWGMMGTGKSSLARELGAHFDIKSLDLDEEIERSQRASISELIKKLGMHEFRAIEAQHLEERLSIGEAQIIAVGGGCLLNADFRRRIRQRATVCSLFADISTLVSRLQGETEERPLLHEQTESLSNRLSSLLKARRYAYLDVDFVMDTTALSLQELSASFGRIYQVSEAA